MNYEHYDTRCENIAPRPAPKPATFVYQPTIPAPTGTIAIPRRMPLAKAPVERTQASLANLEAALKRRTRKQAARDRQVRLSKGLN